MDPEQVAGIGALCARMGSGLTLLALGIIKVLAPQQQMAWTQAFNAIPGVQGMGVIYLNLLLYAEILLGGLLILGLFMRYAAAVGVLLTLLQLFVVNWFAPPQLLGPWGPLFVKDFSLLGALLFLTLIEQSWWSIDEIFH